MRIAYLCSARIPSRAANSVQTIKMCNAFASNGHELTLLSRQGDAAPESVFERYGVPRSFRYVALPQRGVRGTHLLNFLLDVRAELRRRGPFDLYFARDLYSLASVAHEGRPMILEVHRSMRGRRAELMVFDWLWRKRSFKKLVVVSHGMKREYLDLFPDFPEERIQVEPGAADAPKAATVIEPWAGRPEALQLGYIGHLYEGRGIEVLVELAARGPEYDVHVVGGNDADVARWRSRGLPSNLYLHGYVPHARVGSYLARFDVLLAPYQRQVFVDGGDETSAIMSPLKLFEYMAAGKAIVSSDLPVLREVLEDGENALLAVPDDVSSWLSAVERLRRDAELREALGRRAFERYRWRHNWAARARAVLA